MKAIATILVPVTLALGAATEHADAVGLDPLPTRPSPAFASAFASASASASASAPAGTEEGIAIETGDGGERAGPGPHAGEESDRGPAPAQGDRWPVPSKGHQKGGFDFAWFA